MTGKGPRILQAGDLDCVHHEYIDADMIGTCRYCGRVRSFRRVSEDDAASNHKTPMTRLGEVYPSRVKGGRQIGRRVKTSNPTRRQIHVPQPVKVKPKKRPARKGSANDGSARWIDNIAKSHKTLEKGVASDVYPGS